MEISGTYRIMNSWKLHAGYTYFHKELRSKPGHSYGPVNLGHDPGHQIILQSMLDLPGNFQLDLFSRYVGELPNQGVPDYLSLNARLAWMHKNLELSVNGRNLLSERNREFAILEVPRNIYGMITWRL